MSVTELVARARHVAGSGPTWRVDALLRELADALETQAATVPVPIEPSPMSEAPPNRTFYALMALTRHPVNDDANGPTYKDSDGMDWSADDSGKFTMFAGWIPTSSVAASDGGKS